VFFVIIYGYIVVSYYEIL